MRNETKASRPNRSSTPASIAAASDLGTCFMKVSTQPVKPEIVSNSEAKQKRADRFAHRNADQRRGKQLRRAWTRR